MADTKISNLTAATTPLAGTEVLPIVQSGVTKKVSVSDLTAGRAVSALSLTLTNALTGANGGTGVNNGTKTITIGGNVVMSGAYDFTGTLTAGTSVTFPTSGTLATRAGTETLTNKTLGNTALSGGGAIYTTTVTLSGTSTVDITGFTVGKGAYLVIATYDGNDGPAYMWALANNSYGFYGGGLNQSTLQSMAGYSSGTTLAIGGHMGTNYLTLAKNNSSYDGTYRVTLYGL